MDRGILFEAGERTAYLVYNAAAMFALQDAGIQNADVMDETAEGFAKLCTAAEVLSEQGAAVRAYMHLTPAGDKLDALELRLQLGGIGATRLRKAVAEAIIAGIKSDEEETKPRTRDLILEKLTKKKD